MATLHDVLLVSAMLAGLMAGSSQAADSTGVPTRGEAVAVNLPAGPACDGTMEDATWQKCPPWPLGACTSNNSQRYKTWAKVLFDGTHVHVGVFCEEPDTEGLTMKVADRDGPVWNDDSIEVFLRADPQQPVCQFVVNPRGVLYDARNRQAGWNSSAEAKAAIQPGKSWTVTLKVPLNELGAYVGDDQMWTMNVYRSRSARGDELPLQYSWSIMSGNDYHAELEFGIVTGISVPRRPGGVTRVRSTPAPRPIVMNPGREEGGVRIYYRMDFDGNLDAWTAENDGRLSQSDDAVDGKALQLVCAKSWSAALLPVGVAGSRGLKMALSMKGRKLESVGVNIFDAVARDNTTPYGYRYLAGDRWTPILYFLDRCRYNSQNTGFVSPQTIYDSIRFYGPAEYEPGMQFSIDNFVLYRGADTQPPEKVAGLVARATGGGVKLSWDQAADNVAPQVYVISRATASGFFTKIAESPATTFTDTTAGKGSYRYRVLAVDFEENLGGWSDVAKVDSVSDPRPQESTREETDRLDFAEHVRGVHARGVGKVRKGHATLFGDSLTGATVYPHCARAAFGNLTVNAFGYPSMRTSFGRNKVGEILRQDNPEFMFILYGTNNNKAEEHLPAAMDDLAAIVAACQQRGTVAVLGTIPPRGWTSESAPEANFNRHVVELCRKLKIPTGYIFEGFQAAGDRRRYMGGDGVHWTGDGMAIAGKAWGSALEQVRFVLRDRP